MIYYDINKSVDFIVVKKRWYHNLFKQKPVKQLFGIIEAEVGLDSTGKPTGKVMRLTVKDEVRND